MPINETPFGLGELKDCNYYIAMGRLSSQFEFVDIQVGVRRLGLKSAKFVLSLSFALILIAFGLGSVAGNPQPHQYYGEGGGEITGYILVYTISNQPQPIDWAALTASDGEHTFHAFSGMSGMYQMRLPAGTYNVTVEVPGFQAPSRNVTVTDGSIAVVNFYLELSSVAVPEFGTQVQIFMTVTLLIVAIFIANRSSPLPVRDSRGE